VSYAYEMRRTIQALVLGAARIFDFSGSLNPRRDREEEKLLRQLMKPNNVSDWEAISGDGRRVQEDFARAWEKVRKASASKPTP
jgi:hypothetical protein